MQLNDMTATTSRARGAEPTRRLATGRALPVNRTYVGKWHHPDPDRPLRKRLYVVYMSQHDQPGAGDFVLGPSGWTRTTRLCDWRVGKDNDLEIIDEGQVARYAKQQGYPMGNINRVPADKGE